MVLSNLYVLEIVATDCVRIILGHGADPNLRTEDQNTTLCLAAADGILR